LILTKCNIPESDLESPAADRLKNLSVAASDLRARR